MAVVWALGEWALYALDTLDGQSQHGVPGDGASVPLVPGRTGKNPGSTWYQCVVAVDGATALAKGQIQ